MGNESDRHSWGAKEFSLSGLNFDNLHDFSLEGSVKLLPAKAKQAFYGAAMRKGVLRRSTWNGCAFNAGGMELGNDNVTSFASAAQLFNTTETVVKRFIQAWDGSKYPNDREATQALVEILERVGIFTEPDTPKVRIVCSKVYDSTLTEKELLNKFTDDVVNDLDSLDSEFAELVQGLELVMS